MIFSGQKPWGDYPSNDPKKGELTSYDLPKF